MKQIVDLYHRILNEGTDLANDRTGDGRRRIFGAMLDLDISDGKVPFCTIRENFPKNPIAEMLMFTKGINSVEFLKQYNVHIWDEQSVRPESARDMVEKMIEYGIIEPEMALVAMNVYSNTAISSIGLMYGWFWRHWPKSFFGLETEGGYQLHPCDKVRGPDELASDARRAIKEFFQADHPAPGDDASPEEKEAWEKQYRGALYGFAAAAVDQLNDLLQNLKKDPYSSRHIVTSVNPEFFPVDGYLPHIQPIIGKGALMPCHTGFQIFVNPPKEEGGKPRLSLKFEMRSTDAVLGLPTNLAGYTILANLIARHVDMETDRLIWSGGDVHIYLTHIEDLKKILDREPYPEPTLWLNPDKTDLFSFEFEDIRFDNYRFHPSQRFKLSI